MSFEPRRRSRDTTSGRAGRPGCSGCPWSRVTTSQAAAPASMASMSMPWSAAGRRPTAESSLVRPPTQSHIGKRASQPSRRLTLSIFEPAPVTATACLAKSRPAAL